MPKTRTVSRLSLAVAASAGAFALLCLASLQWGAAIAFAVLGAAQWACSWWVHSSPSALAARGTPDGGPRNVDRGTVALTYTAYAGLFLVLLVYLLAALFSPPFSDVRVLAMTQMVVLFGTWGISNLVFARLR